MKKILSFIAICLFFVLGYSSFALTKPEPGADTDNLSYEFYLYYDNGQLYSDRDYEIKFDVVNEPYVSQEISEGAYIANIVSLTSEVAKTFNFDPKSGNPSLKAGKITVKGPYVPDAQQVDFYNPLGMQLFSIHVSAASICNDDGSCNSAAGESEKTCPNDCKKPRPTPTPVTIDESEGGFLGLGFDLNSILIYVVGTVGIAVVGWLGWKWWRKRRESAFIPSMPADQNPPMPPVPPLN